MKLLCVVITLLDWGTYVECTVCPRVEVVTTVTVDCLLVGCSAAVERYSKVLCSRCHIPDESNVYTVWAFPPPTLCFEIEIVWW